MAEHQKRVHSRDMIAAIGLDLMSELLVRVGCGNWETLWRTGLYGSWIKMRPPVDGSTISRMRGTEGLTKVAPLLPNSSSQVSYRQWGQGQSSVARTAEI
jgi:hypothetical protein